MPRKVSVLEPEPDAAGAVAIDSEASTDLKPVAARPNGQIPPFPRPLARDLSKAPQKGLDYWRSLWEKLEFRSRLIVYFYRVWPAIDKRETMNAEERARYDARNKGNPARQIAKFYDEEPLTLADMYHRFGAGGYHIKINDSETNKTVCMFTFEGANLLNDYGQGEPDVDPQELVWGHPANKTYEEFLRKKGIQGPLTEAQETIEEEETVNTAVVEQLSGTVKDLADKIGDSADKRVEEMKERVTSANAARPVDIDQQAALRGMELTAKAGEMGMKIIDAAVSKGQALSAATSNPVEMFDKALVWAEKMGKQNGAAVAPAVALIEESPLVKTLLQEVTNLRTQLATNQENQLRDLREEMRALRTAKETAPAAVAPPDPFDFLKKAMGSFRELQEGFGDGVGSGGGKVDKIAQYLQYAPPVLQGISGLVQAGAYAWGLGKAASANPAPPGRTGTAPGSNPSLAASNPPAPPPMTPEQEAQMQTTEQYRRLVAFAEGPILRALDNAKPGDEFAQNLIDMYGASAFHALRDLGATPEERKTNVARLLAQFSPRLREKMQQAPQQVERFLDEFLAVDLGPGEDDEMPEGTPAA